MKYYFDTEFSEDGKTIELISIGIVSADNREYYAVSSEFDPESCNDWVKANVLPLLPPKTEWKPRAQIRDEIREFCSARGQRPEFISFCASYDWVVLVQLFGTMAQLPSGWPWWVFDIRQLQAQLGDPKLPEHVGTAHDALDDAKWHKAAYDFLRELALSKRIAAVAAVQAIKI